MYLFNVMIHISTIVNHTQKSETPSNPSIWTVIAVITLLSAGFSFCVWLMMSK